MVRRLIEADYERCAADQTEDKLRFWLRESRTPVHLIEIAAKAPGALAREIARRPLLRFARPGNQDALEKALLAEQEEERARDREYWRPLRAELEAMRLARGASD